MLILCQMFCEKLLVEREHQYKTLYKTFSIKDFTFIFELEINLSIYSFKDFMEHHGKCRKGKTYTQSKNLFADYISFQKKDGSPLKYEGFQFKTCFVLVKIKINRLDDIEMQPKICISFQQFQKFQEEKICYNIIFGRKATLDLGNKLFFQRLSCVSCWYAGFACLVILM